MTKPLVSLIIPIYNAARTLVRCLESVAAQSCQELQVILVNDGSTDGSLAICRCFAERDARFQVLDRPNAGVSTARNCGIAAARGTYLMFADSDDYLPPDAVVSFLQAAQMSGADLVISDFYRVSGEKCEVKGDIRQEGVLNRREFAREMMEKPSDFYYGVMWNKLYRRSVVYEHAMELDSRVKWCEDLLFNLLYLGQIQTVYVLKKPLYYYVNNANSLAKQSATLRNWLRMKRMVYEKYRQLFEELGMYEKATDILRVARFFTTVATDGAVHKKPNELLRKAMPPVKPAKKSRSKQARSRKQSGRTTGRKRYSVRSSGVPEPVRTTPRPRGKKKERL